VRVALDSAPQGATVTAASGPVGKTPVILQLPRSEEVVELKLTKPGFVPLLFKVIPQQDKDVVAKLQRGSSRSGAATFSPVAAAPGKAPAAAVAPGPAKLPGSVAAAPAKVPAPAPAPAKAAGMVPASATKPSVRR
jgi:hypothetical protein